MELSLRAKQDHVEKVARTRDSVKALAEFVWNSLDADSNEVSVIFEKNGLGGIGAVQIIDDGAGISHERAKSEFEGLGASWKRKVERTPQNRAMHGKEGRGRFKFFSISDHARWRSHYLSEDGLRRLDLHIAGELLEKSTVSEPQTATQATSGTSVTLSPLKPGNDWLVSSEARQEFSAIFASYLMQYPGVKIYYDGTRIDPKTLISRSFDFPPERYIAADRIIDDLRLRVIEWGVHTDGRKLHFGAEAGVVLGSQPANVTAPGFEFSAYASSKFFQEMADANLLEIEDLSDPVFVSLTGQIRERLAAYFRSRQAERAKSLIDELKESGAYPYVGDPANDLERREREVFDIATYAVSSYSPNFKKAEDSIKKMTLTLLKEAVRHNPESLTHILQAVVSLPKARQDEFSALLKHTELSNIINASSMIADRVTLLETLKGVVFSSEHKATIKERGELDVMIRDNTWIFGERFHITLPEAGLTRVMDRVAEDQGLVRKRVPVKTQSGRAGRLDQFLGRSVPQSEFTKKEYIVIELKRPSLQVGRKELDQLEDYVNALTSQTDWHRTETLWSFYLVTGEISEQIVHRVTQKDRPVGLFLEGETYKVWVKTWSELVRECESRLQFIQNELRYEIGKEEIEGRIAAIKSAFVKEDRIQTNLAEAATMATA